jgi:hypothetical protein
MDGKKYSLYAMEFDGLTGVLGQEWSDQEPDFAALGLSPADFFGAVSRAIFAGDRDAAPWNALCDLAERYNINSDLVAMTRGTIKQLAALKK